MDRPIFSGYVIGVGLAIGAGAALLLKLADAVVSMVKPAK